MTTATPPPGDVPPLQDVIDAAPAGWGTGQSVLDPEPASDREAELRRHSAVYVLIALDPKATLAEREGALRHLVSCDPVRAIGQLISLAMNAFEVMEADHGHEPGEVVASLRAELEHDEELKARAAEVVASLQKMLAD
jgi:hypothetical protein